MEVLLFLLPFVLLGIAVLFIAFSGSPGAAREAYLTRGNRAFRVAIPLLYIALGVAVPALIIASRDEAEGGTDALKTEELSADAEEGKQLFQNALRELPRPRRRQRARGDRPGPGRDRRGHAASGS